MTSFKYSSFADYFFLDRKVCFLNHGSFGACPKEVLKAQTEMREEMEREPVLFLDRNLGSEIWKAKEALAEFTGADPHDIAFVPNATAGVNAVLRSLDFKPGDEILTTNHEYNACGNAVAYVASRLGATVKKAAIPFPIGGADEAFDAVMSAVTDKTKLAMISHITSPTALVLPVEKLTAELEGRGVTTLIDGAHAPGMLPLNLNALGASFYTGNCHKWMCAPKGSAFLCVRKDRQALVHPTSISHGAYGELRPNATRFSSEFDWTGTSDPTSYLCVKTAKEKMAEMVDGGWAEIMRRNRESAAAMRRALCEKLSIEPPCPSEMLGSMATLPITFKLKPLLKSFHAESNDLQHTLFENYRIEIPIIKWGGDERLTRIWFRISSQIYNDASQYDYLAEALNDLRA